LLVSVHRASRHFFTVFDCKQKPKVTMDILAKRPNLLFLIAIRHSVDICGYKSSIHTCPSKLYRRLLCTNLRKNIYYQKWLLLLEYYKQKAGNQWYIYNIRNYITSYIPSPHTHLGQSKTLGAINLIETLQRNK
jgi:hypothetical protein